MTRVLIVEDSATQAAELSLLLESEGFEVAIERDGLSGLRRCGQDPYDVVLSDVIMPGIDGYELCRRAKNAPETRDLPIILLTSLAEPLDIIRGLECGADNFITKPYEGKYLVGRIRQLLENRGLRARKKMDVGVELVLMGKRFTINSQKEQMLDLLISTFEEVLRSRQREYDARLAEESFRQSHRLLQSALDALSAHIAIADMSGEIVAVNASWRRMGDVCDWRWPASGVGQDYRVVLETAFGADPEQVRIALDGLRAVQTGQREFFYHEYTGRVRNDKRWFGLSATRFEGNGLTLLAIENDDITERKRAAEEIERSETALRKQTQILNSILNSMSEAVLVVDPKGDLLLVNRQAESMFGVVRGGGAELDCNDLFQAYTPDQKTQLARSEHPMSCAMRGDSCENTNLFCKSRSDAAGTTVSVAVTPLRDESGASTGGVVVLRDVTEQRKLEQQLQQSQKMEAIGQLAGGVAHDFNNLLSVISSYGALLLRDFPERDRRRDDLKEMLEAAKRASHLTRQLLAFSRRQLVQPTVLNLNSVVSNIERMLSRIIGEDIELTLALEPALGRVKADAGQIEQILLNLSVNARDAMPNGGKLTIETANVTLDHGYPNAHAGVTPGPFVVFSVTDTGTGMDAETQARIFEPFFTTKEVGKGTGLGLSTVYGIVRQSGGHVWVYSEPGQGTSFKVYLPTVDEPLTERKSVQPSSQAQPVNESILLVEDDAAVRLVAYRILKYSGYQVYEAKDAAQARAICSDMTQRVDLLLTDVVMPDTNGPELALELSRMRPGLRILYMSGYAGGAVMRHGRLPPGVAFVDKPFTPESLTSKVRETLTANTPTPP